MEPLSLNYPEQNEAMPLRDALEILKDDRIVPLLVQLGDVPNHGPQFLAHLLISTFNLVSVEDEDIEDDTLGPYVFKFQHSAWYIIEFSSLARKYGRDNAIQIFSFLMHKGAATEQSIFEWYETWYFEDPFYIEEHEAHVEAIKRRNQRVNAFWNHIADTQAWKDEFQCKFYGIKDYPELLKLYQCGVWLESNAYVFLTNTNDMEEVYPDFVEFMNEQFGNMMHNADYIPISYHDVYFKANELETCLNKLLSGYTTPVIRNTAKTDKPSSLLPTKTCLPVLA